LNITTETKRFEYGQSLDAAIGWLLRSAEHGRGGSCGYFGIWGRWSAPYPETTGYIIPTLLSYRKLTGHRRSKKVALDFGNWLLTIQTPQGYWHAGLHPPARPKPSIFNTGQILIGLAALFKETGDEKWLESAIKACKWLVNGLDDQGLWKIGNYREGYNPSYYAHVAWPMLGIWKLTGDRHLREAAELVLGNVLKRRLDNGVISGWAFFPGKPAVTHTMAYTLHGILESAQILDDWETYGMPAMKALEYLADVALHFRGKMPGAFDDNWKPVKWYTCLTGNAQLAICFIKNYEIDGKPKWVDAARELVAGVQRAQRIRHPIIGMRGAIAGSKPIWGGYMIGRFPNWAAKYFCDALMKLSALKK
jgi:uncharacterized protein YyaL (SSP411 family)